MAVLVLPSQLTHAGAAACLRMLEQSLGRELSEPVCVDASALTDFDSSALAVLLGCRREVLNRGQMFSVRGLHPRLRALAEVYGVQALLPAAD